MPLPSARCMSTIATSGRSFSASGTPSPHPTATPATSRSGSAPSRRSTPAATAGWSSTTTRWNVSTAVPTPQPSRTGVRSTMGGTRQTAEGWTPYLGLDEAAADGVTGQVHAVAQAQLLQDVRAVALHRLLAQHEQCGDLL